jgi:hypothetical protein
MIILISRRGDQIKYIYQLKISEEISSTAENRSLKKRSVFMRKELKHEQDSIFRNHLLGVTKGMTFIF